MTFDISSLNIQKDDNDKVTEFTVDRTYWYRGNGNTNSRLLRKEDGDMCCLGFYSLACGLSKTKILDKSFPSSVKYNGEKIPDEMLWLLEGREAHGEWLEDIIGSFNDDSDIFDNEREAQILKNFADQGIKVNFIN